MKDGEGNSPLDVAMTKNSGRNAFDIALYLFNHGCSSSKDKGKLLILSCERGELKVVKELVEHHNVNPKGEGSTYMWLGSISPHHMFLQPNN